MKTRCSQPTTGTRQNWQEGGRYAAWFRPPVPLLFFLLLALGALRLAHAQPGSWQAHPSYRAGQSVAVVGNTVYAATQNGFFLYDKASGETATLGRQQGLSDAGISRLLYLADQNRLFIGYRNGNIDLLTVSATGQPGAVQNINTIVSAPNLPASRAINHLNRVGNTAYLSTDFGLVTFDLLRNEIRDTYFSRRADGSAVPIRQTAATADSLYALTADSRTGGVQAIRFSPGVNIADPANWRPVPAPAPGSSVESLLTTQNRLLASVNSQGVFERRAGQWVPTQPFTNPIVRLFAAPASSAVATNQSVTAGSASFSGPLLTDPREVAVDENQVWVADGQSGLLRGSSAGFERIGPEGPLRDAFARLYAYPQTLVGLPAGPQTTVSVSANEPPAEAYSVPNGRWQPVSATGPAQGFNSAAYLPAEQRLFLGSFGGGLWTQVPGQPLAAVTLPASMGPFISSLATDGLGNVWIATNATTTGQNVLYVRRPDGTFQAGAVLNTFSNVVQVVPDDNGFLWIQLDGGSGLLVVDSQSNQSRFLSTQRGSGGLLSNNVRALVKDRTGAIWVGTDAGPTVFDNPAAAFDAVVDAQPPLLSGRRLLANEIVTAIAVDGGNRKWMATRSGLYRVAPDGSQLLDAFTPDTSPLPDNTIQALAIEPLSGRVFVQTGRGLVSYVGPATEPAESLRELTIFPNPVRPDFTGTVGINGLTDNATVKILDAGGQLVYETRSQGGTATWNLQDYRGRSAQTGVYLVVIVRADGSEGLAGKLAVVR